MSCKAALLAIAVSMLCVNTAQAERRLFIIANDAGGYGVDRCLANGAACGAAAAAAYCRSREFKSAVSFRKVDREEITGAVPTASSTNCRGDACGTFVAIECNR
ncbi:MAG TPA: hypothetical protein VFA53_03125 [Xanthobacteraceae bacterium]|nr:hypothetical protein [Xanthobacteraceae bacterium]